MRGIRGSHLFVFFLATLFALSAHAAPCPERLNYSDGSSLKNGNLLYYPNGSPIGNANVILYPNSFQGRGGLLLGMSDAYYPDGSQMMSGRTVYYANGRLMSDGIRHYNAQGVPMGMGAQEPIWPISGGLPFGKVTFRAQPTGPLMVLELERIIQEYSRSGQDLVQLTRFVPATGTVVFRIKNIPYRFSLLVNMNPNGQFNCTWSSP